MSLELLQELATARMPRTVTSASEIKRLRELRDAGFIAAFLPRSDALPGGGEGFTARVLAVTQKGREELRQHQQSTMSRGAGAVQGRMGDEPR